MAGPAEYEMLALVQVTKSFGDKTAVRNVSLTFESGKTHVLIGPSGCGKSTLLRMLIGLISVDAGTITIDGQPVGRAGLLPVAGSIWIRDSRWRIVSAPHGAAKH